MKTKLAALLCSAFALGFSVVFFPLCYAAELAMWVGLYLGLGLAQ